VKHNPFIDRHGLRRPAPTGTGTDHGRPAIHLGRDTGALFFFVFSRRVEGGNSDEPYGDGLGFGNRQHKRSPEMERGPGSQGSRLMRTLRSWMAGPRCCLITNARASIDPLLGSSKCDTGRALEMANGSWGSVGASPRPGIQISGILPGIGCVGTNKDILSGSKGKKIADAGLFSSDIPTPTTSTRLQQLYGVVPSRAGFTTVVRRWRNPVRRIAVGIECPGAWNLQRCSRLRASFRSNLGRLREREKLV